MVDDPAPFSAGFERLGIVLKPNEALYERLGVLNPGSARLRDGSLRLYPRLVAQGNVSSIGSFRVDERPDGSVHAGPCGFALEPSAAYELRDQPGGHGCEEPRVTFIPAIDRYVMAYVAFGPQGPAVALAISVEGLVWERLGLVRFENGAASVADKDAAFFPEPVTSPSGVASLAFYHRPTLEAPEAGSREGCAIGYVSLAAVRSSLNELCTVTESHRLELPPADWGTIKVGAGAPPIRVREGWLAVIHGVDMFELPSGAAVSRYCAGIVVHDAEHLDRVVYRSPSPLIVPEVPGEIAGTVSYVVFPTAIDRRGDRTFDLYYGMADYEIGRGRLTLPA